MRIMTSNIWGDYFKNPPRGRDDNLFSVFEKYVPDVLGFQEVTKSWYESSLFENLSRDYYFVGTEIIGSSNFVPLAIKKNATLISKGFEYLEGTPDKSKAITWAVVEQNGKIFALCNTHFWWMRGTEPEPTKRNAGVLDLTLDDHCRLRANNAKQLFSLMKHIQDRYSCPVFAFGDMNATIEEEVFQIYRQNGVKMLYDIAKNRDNGCTMHGDPIRQDDGSYHGVRATDDYLQHFRTLLCLPERSVDTAHHTSIDHIVGFGEDFWVSEYRIIEDQQALDATDHSPVYADVEFI